MSYGHGESAYYSDDNWIECTVCGELVQDCTCGEEDDDEEMYSS